MIKKLVSKALLSVVMDKDARARLDDLARIKEARKIIENAPPPPPAPEPEPEVTHELIMEALRSASDGLKERKEMTPDRQALIQQALAVQQSKQHVFDDLTAEQREKLYVVAMKSLKLDPAEDAAAPKKPRRKPKPRGKAGKRGE